MAYVEPKAATGPVRLSWTITHVPTDPQRRRFVRRMLDQLELEAEALARPTPCCDAEQEVQRPVGEVVNDWQREGCWPTHRRAVGAGILYRARYGATHHIMLQDDVALCRDFLPTVQRLVSLNSNNLLGLYAARKVMRRAREERKSWMVIPDGIWGPAFVVPSHWLGIFLSWVDRTFPAGYPSADRRWCFFLLNQERPAWCTAPSLVQHVLPAGSLMGHSNRTRHAIWWPGNKRSALDVDWTAGLQDPVRGPASLGLADFHKAVQWQPKGAQHANT